MVHEVWPRNIFGLNPRFSMIPVHMFHECCG
jgi:hypothetical protein